MTPPPSAAPAPSTYICCGRTLSSSTAVVPRCRSCGGTMKLVER